MAPSLGSLTLQNNNVAGDSAGKQRSDSESASAERRSHGREASRRSALRISAPKGLLVLLVVLDYPPNYQYETDWYQKKTHITTDDFFEWKWYNHCYCKD
jgi:hypothetical protein